MNYPLILRITGFRSRHLLPISRSRDALHSLDTNVQINEGSCGVTEKSQQFEPLRLQKTKVEEVVEKKTPFAKT